MRVGLVGTGYWSEVTHAVALRTTPGIELAGVFGRNPAATQALAYRLGVRAYRTYAALLNDVETVEFAVPPSVQAELAIQAAEKGKHLLLEKPVALDSAAADSLVDVVDRVGVSTVVFFTWRFQAEIANWLDEVACYDLRSAHGAWVNSALTDTTTPWARSAWRWERGGLWDLGPHALSIVLPIMGGVTTVEAVRGRGDLVHVLLGHDKERVTSLEFSLRAPPAAQRQMLSLWSTDGTHVLPKPGIDSVNALRCALRELLQCKEREVVRHPLDVRFGREIVHVIERAQRKLTAD